MADSSFKFVLTSICDTYSGWYLRYNQCGSTFLSGLHNQKLVGFGFPRAYHVPHGSYTKEEVFLFYVTCYIIIIIIIHM